MIAVSRLKKKKKKKIHTHTVKLKLKKHSGLNLIRTHDVYDLCDTGAALNKLSYQANSEPDTLRRADLSSNRSALMLRNDIVISFMHTYYMST